MQGASTMPEQEKKELTTMEVAKILRLSDETVKRRIRAGLLKARVEGRNYRINQADLDDYIRRTQYRPEEQD